MISREFGGNFARERIEAWNGRDLDEVFSHYSDDFTMSLPYNAQIAGVASGSLTGKMFVVVSRRVPAFTRRPVLAGMAFGVMVFLAMRLVVLPLSAFPHPVTFRPLATVLDLLSHMFFFGVPIALAARKAGAER